MQLNQSNNMNTININVPFERRNLRAEIKQRHGKFDPTTKTWALIDTPENRQLADLIQRPIAAPTPEERITNVVTTMVELLNAIKFRHYRLTESGTRIVLESEPMQTEVK